MTELTKIIQNDTLLDSFSNNIKCDRTDCDSYGRKPVCYMIVYDDCKEYENETTTTSN